jgi:peroxiredoxin
VFQRDIRLVAVTLPIGENDKKKLNQSTRKKDLCLRIPSLLTRLCAYDIVLYSENLKSIIIAALNNAVKYLAARYLNEMEANNVKCKKFRTGGAVTIENFL